MTKLKVKQLEWSYHSKFPIVDTCYTQHAFGYYDISNENGRYSLDNGVSLVGYFVTRQEAQEFAQQMFNKLVLSCVETEE